MGRSKSKQNRKRISLKRKRKSREKRLKAAIPAEKRIAVKPSKKIILKDKEAKVEETVEKKTPAKKAAAKTEAPKKAETAKKAAAEPNFYKRLEDEAHELTSIGNNFTIRHSETYQVPLELSEHVDYLFHRLFALIRLLLRTTGRGG